MSLEPLTPVTFFPTTSIYSQVVLKREDLSETGSHKFRYAKKTLEELKASDVKSVVLSTTGNAGITLSHYGKALGIKVICLMSDRGDLSKAAQIEQEGGIVIVSSRPVRFSKYLAKKYEMPLLRVSQDEESVAAYRSLGAEIRQQVPEADAIVNFASSGASSLGIAQAYDQLPALHIAQTGRSTSIVKALHPDSVPDSDAAGLEDTPYREALLKVIRQSGGDAWYISPEEQQKAADILAEFDIETSMESLCSFATALKIRDRYQQIVVVLSGRRWPSVDFSPSHTAESFADLDALMQAL